MTPRHSSLRIPGARDRQTSAQTAAAFIQSYVARSTREGRRRVGRIYPPLPRIKP